MTAFLLTKGNLRNTHLAQQRRRCLDNIKIYLKEVRRGGVYCTDVGKDHVAGSYEQGTEPSDSVKRGAFDQQSNY